MSVESQQAHELSAALFNNSYFVTVVRAIAAITSSVDEFVTTRKIAAASGLGDSLVRPVVLRLEAAGLLQRLPRGGARSEQHFARSDSAAWSHLADLCATVSNSHH